MPGMIHKIIIHDRHGCVFFCLVACLSLKTLRFVLQQWALSQRAQNSTCALAFSSKWVRTMIKSLVKAGLNIVSQIMYCIYKVIWCVQSFEKLITCQLSYVHTSLYLHSTKLRINALGNSILFTHSEVQSHVAGCRKSGTYTIADTLCHGLLRLSELQDSMNFKIDRFFCSMTLFRNKSPEM